MVENNKIINKKLRLRTTIFSSGTISRQELIRNTGLNTRSVIAYADELCKQGIISQSKEENPHGGRPSIHYHSCSEKICCAGITLLRNVLGIIVVDVNSWILFSKMLTIPENASITEMITLVFRQIEEFRKQFPDKVLMRIALSRNPYSSSHSKFFTAMPELTLALSKHFAVPAELYKSSEVILLHQIQRSNITEPSVLLSSGDEINVAMVENGQIVPAMHHYERKLAHCQFSARSLEKCYCGKWHCICNTMTTLATVRRYYHLKGQDFSALQAKAPNPDNFYQECYNNLHARGDAGEAAARRIQEERGQLWAELICRVKEDLHAKHVFISFRNRVTYQKLEQAYAELTGEALPIQAVQVNHNADVICATASIARIKVLSNS